MATGGYGDDYGVDAREERLLQARDRLEDWAHELEARQQRLQTGERELERREAAVSEAQKELTARSEALRKRVAVLDAADQQRAAESRAALEAAAVTVLQRWGRRVVAVSRARKTMEGLRKLRHMEERLAQAQSEFSARGNVLLLEDTLTKLLEAADGIPTRPGVLRARRKAFVRRVMAMLEDPTNELHRDDDDMSTTSSSSASDSVNDDSGNSDVSR